MKSLFSTDPIYSTSDLCKINPKNPGCGGSGNGGSNGGNGNGANGGGDGSGGNQVDILDPINGNANDVGNSGGDGGDIQPNNAPSGATGVVLYFRAITLFRGPSSLHSSNSAHEKVRSTKIGPRNSGQSSFLK